MTITENDLAAFADGELDDREAARIAQAVAADPELAMQVERHRALRARLGAHFAPILAQEVPTRLSQPLQQHDKVVPFGRALAEPGPRTRSRWGWVAGTALAASLAIAMIMPSGGEGIDGYAGTELAQVLDRQLVARQADDAQTRILLSFRREDGDYCRAFASSEQSGIACRDDRGWELVTQMAGALPDSGEYRQAGNPQADLLAAAQEMAVAGALDARAEQAAREAGWRD